jgi:hypothetical protein
VSGLQSDLLLKYVPASQLLEATQESQHARGALEQVAASVREWAVRRGNPKDAEM